MTWKFWSKNCDCPLKFPYKKFLAYKVVKIQLNNPLQSHFLIYQSNLNVTIWFHLRYLYLFRYLSSQNFTNSQNLKTQKQQHVHKGSLPKQKTWEYPLALFENKKNELKVNLKQNLKKKTEIKQTNRISLHLCLQ